MGIHFKLTLNLCQMPIEVLAIKMQYVRYYLQKTLCHKNTQTIINRKKSGLWSLGKEAAY